MTTNIVQVRKKGSITLPMDLRAKYMTEEGDVFNLIDMGDGSFVLTPRMLQVKRLGDRVAEILDEQGMALDDLLATLDNERERFYKDHYAKE